MLKFYVAYRAESDDGLLVYTLLGATPVGDGRWSFWVWDADPYGNPTLEHTLADLEDLGGGIVRAKVVLGEDRLTTTFTPITADYLSAHAEEYRLTEAQKKSLITPGYLNAFFFTDMATQYEDAYAPKEVAESIVEDTAPIGAMKMVRGAFYEKQQDGTWIKVDWFP